MTANEIGAMACGFGLGVLATLFAASRLWRWAWKRRRALISKLTWWGDRGRG